MHWRCDLLTPGLYLYFQQADPDNFGDVEKTAFSLFQVSTGDSWASSITRGLVERNPEMPAVLLHLFFVLVFLMIGVVLMNVVIAILLDEFLTTVAKEKLLQRKREMIEKSRSNITIGSDRRQPLDPLLAGLVTFTTEEDLLSKIGAIYEAMDLDESGSMSLEELNAGLKLFSLGQQVQLSTEDWDILGEDGKFLNADGEMGPAGFQDMILRQLRMYTNRQIAMVMNQLEDDDDDDNDGVDRVNTLALKMIMNYLHQLEEMMREVHSAVDPEGSSEYKRRKRSRMQVIMGLKNLPLRRAFIKWALVIQESYRLKGIDGAKSLSEIIKHMDDSHCHDAIGFDQLVSFFAQSHTRNVSDPIAHAHRIFRNLDKDNSDTIKHADLHMAIKQIENEMSESELILCRLELLDTKMSRMDNKMSHIDTKVERIKSEVQTAMDERLHERIRLELSALNGDGGSRGGSIAHSAGIKPTMVNTEIRNTPYTPDLSLAQRGYYSRRREIADIRREIAESMEASFKESSPADTEAGRLAGIEVMQASCK